MLAAEPQAKLSKLPFTPDVRVQITLRSEESIYFGEDSVANTAAAAEPFASAHGGRGLRGAGQSEVTGGPYVVTRSMPRPPSSDKSQLASISRSSDAAQTDPLVSVREFGAHVDPDDLLDDEVPDARKRLADRARKPPKLMTTSTPFLSDPVSHDGTRPPTDDKETQSARLFDVLDACVGPTADGRRNFSCQASSLYPLDEAEVIEYPPPLPRPVARSPSSGLTDGSSDWDPDTESLARWTPSISAKWELEAQQPYVVVREWPPPGTRQVQLQVGLYKTEDREAQTEAIRLVRDVILQTGSSPGEASTRVRSRDWPSALSGSLGPEDQPAVVFAIVAIRTLPPLLVAPVPVPTEHKATQTEQRVQVVDGSCGPTPDNEDALWCREMQTDDPDFKLPPGLFCATSIIC